MVYKKGFTLAEVLIALTIIGLIAVITVPSIIQSYNKRVAITKLQKAYTTLERAFINIAINTNCVGNKIKCTGLLDASETTLRTNFINLSGLKVKRTYIAGSNIQYVSLNYAKNDIKIPDTVSWMAITNDNIGYYITAPEKLRNSSQKGILAVIFTNPEKVVKDALRHSGSIYTSKDSILGRNVFRFIIWDDFKIEPALRVNGGEGQNCVLSVCRDAASYCISGNTSTSIWYSGAGCTAKIIQDGWKMNY